MSLPVVRVRPRGVIGSRDGDVLVCASVGPADEAVSMWTTPQGLAAVTSAAVSAGGARFPDPAPARPVTARITVHTPGLEAVTPIADLALAHVTVQPMPGGRFLVAGARCRWRRDGSDRNGVLPDADGQVAGKGVLGDGIGPARSGRLRRRPGNHGRLRRPADTTRWLPPHRESLRRRLSLHAINSTT